MSEQPGFQAVPQIPTQGVSQFMITLNASDVLITVGHGRIIAGVDQNGVPTAQPVVEWLMSLSISPTSAKILLNQLGQSLEKYEELFGKIPLDPKITTTLSDASR